MSNKLRQILIAAREREAHARSRWLPEDEWAPMIVDPDLLERELKARRKTARTWNGAIGFKVHSRHNQVHAD